MDLLYGLGIGLIFRTIIQLLVNQYRQKDGKNVLDLAFGPMFLSWFAAYVITVAMMME